MGLTQGCQTYNGYYGSSSYTVDISAELTVSKLNCTLEGPALTCMDQFEKAWDFERK